MNLKCKIPLIGFWVFIALLIRPSAAAVAFPAMGVSLGYEALSYIHPSPLARELISSSLNLGWQGASQGSILEASIQATAMFSLNGDAYHYLELPEAYLGTSPRLGSTQFVVGRKLQHWNHLDEWWQLGIWQPRFRWDYLSPQVVGLTGAFLSVRYPLFQFTAFGSPGFIPERGVPVANHDGNLTSPSEWFIAPPAEVPLLGQDTRVRYSLDLPPIREIVSHPGMGIMTRVGEEGNGFWGSFAYAYKPINQILLGYDAYYKHPSNEVEATLYPRVAYHHLASIEAGLIGDSMSTWISLLNERPVQDQALAQWTVQQLSSSLAFSSTFDVEVIGKGEEATHLDMSYLRQWGGDAADQGPFAKQESVFEPRYLYKNAIRLGMNTSFPGVFGHHFRAASHLIYDIPLSGTVFSAEIKFKPHEAWAVGIGADVFNVNSNRSDGSIQDNSFISRYRMNDRVHGKVTYAF